MLTPLSDVSKDIVLRDLMEAMKYGWSAKKPSLAYNFKTGAPLHYMDASPEIRMYWSTVHNELTFLVKHSPPGKSTLSAGG